MNLNSLTAVPWVSVRQEGEDGPTGKFILAQGLTALAIFDREDDCDFAALARNAFDVMMRRKWSVGWSTDHGGKYPPAWYVLQTNGYKLNPIGGPGYFYAVDPFSALVAADEWYKANVEAKQP